MSEPYPISCISCRRKKIKCNKFNPCNQCKKRNIICQFPATFRNIEINQSDSVTDQKNAGSDDSNLLCLPGGNNINQNNGSQNSNCSDSRSSSLPGSTCSINSVNSLTDDCFKIINKLKSDKSELLESNYQLTEQTKFLKQKLKQYNVELNYQDSPNQPHKHGLHNVKSYENNKYRLSGETSEFGKRFYGPQSSSFMMETLKSNSSIDKNNYPKNYLDDDDNLKMENSLLKKYLPLLKADLSFNDNLKLIYILVDKFFNDYSSNFYKTFISKRTVMKFLNDYASMDNNEWENDDDLLLLTIILVLSVIRLTPMEFTEIFKIDYKDYHTIYNSLIQSNLLYNFEKLRHNLIDESILTIQSYILCTEFYFIEQRYEECWSRMFHTCSIAYSIGLHVTAKLKANQLELINNSILVDPSNSDNDNDTSTDDEGEDILKLKVWFCLRILSDKICSILGRPNPISIQVNLVVLKYNKNYKTINLNGRNTSILLKIGLSECIRLSNMMLIENFMIDFTMNDLLKLNSKFEIEIEMLENYVADLELTENDVVTSDEHPNNPNYKSIAPKKRKYLDGVDAKEVKQTKQKRQITSGKSKESLDNKSDNTNNNINETTHQVNDYSNPNDQAIVSSKEMNSGKLNHLPLKVDKINIINDLIIFYVNKAKLFEPFILKFDKNENDIILILKNLTNSIINFLQLIHKFLKIFEVKLINKDVTYLKLGKYFRINFPFLNSFVYQGIVIIFTLLNYKFRDFVNLKFNDKFDNVAFLNELKTHLNNLMAVDSNFNDKIWSINILYLVNRNLEIIDIIEQQQQALVLYQQQQQQQQPHQPELTFENQNQDQNPQIEQPVAPQVTEYQIYSQEYQNLPDAANLFDFDMYPLNFQSPQYQPDPNVNIPISSNNVINNDIINPQFNDLDNTLVANTLANNANDFININLNDPFWITNPDNLPYYLSSPKEEVQKKAEKELSSRKLNRQSAPNQISNYNLEVDMEDNIKKPTVPKLVKKLKSTIQQPQPQPLI